MFTTACVAMGVKQQRDESLVNELVFFKTVDPVGIVNCVIVVALAVVL